MTVTMPYREFKQHYADCQIVRDSYNPINKTIRVEVPNGIELKIESMEVDLATARKMKDVEIFSMYYGMYKEHYADCKTVKGTYNTRHRSIDVIVPKGRMKPSGVRGKHFHGYELWLEDKNGEKGFCTYRAVCKENAMKQHEKYCKQEGWTPCEPPEGEIARIYL